MPSEDADADADPKDRAEALFDRAQTDPERVDVEDVLAGLEPLDVTVRRTAMRTLLELAEHDPETVDRAVEQLSAAPSFDDDEHRSTAARALALLAREHPERASAALPTLAALVDDEYYRTQSGAAEALDEIARHDPDAVADVVPDLEAAFVAVPPSERGPFVALLDTMVDERPEAVVPLVPALLEAFEDDPESVREAFPPLDSGEFDAAQVDPAMEEAFERQTLLRRATGELLRDLARARPAALAPHVERVLDVVENADDGQLERSGVEIVGVVAEVDPEAARPAIPALADCLSIPEPGLAGKAAWALGVLAETHLDAVTDAVRPHVDEVAGLLDADDPSVRGAAAGLLSYLAESDPDAVEPVVPALVDVLEDERVFVRGSAVIALGYAGDESTISALEPYAGEDADPEVAGTARDAIERIEARERDGDGGDAE